MGDFAKPQVTSYDPTNPATRGVQTGANQFLQQLLASPTGFATAFQNQNAMNAGGQMMNQAQANPEGDVLKMLMPLLQGMAGQKQPELQFQNGFNELQNQFGDMGAVNQAQNTLMAALPQFDRNLQRANATLMNTAPGRFSSRLAQEGTDLNTQALNDYNLFANQALMQGQQLQSQERNNALNFMLGARGLQQGAAQNTAQNQIAARGLSQEGNRDQLSAAGLMGQLASNAGNGQFNRTLQAGNFGLAQQNAIMNPTLQLLMSAFGWGQPQQLTPIVNPSGLQTLLGGVQAAAGAYNMVKPNGGRTNTNVPWGGYAPGMGWSGQFGGQ